eukprot:9603-Heterococcus_DN1.PRE.1
MADSRHVPVTAPTTVQAYTTERAQQVPSRRRKVNDSTTRLSNNVQADDTAHNTAYMHSSAISYSLIELRRSAARCSNVQPLTAAKVAE